MPFEWIKNNWDKALWFIGGAGSAVYGAGRMVARHDAVHQADSERYKQIEAKLDSLMQEHVTRTRTCPSGFPGKVDAAIVALREEIAATRNLSQKDSSEMRSIMCSLQGTLETLMQLLPELLDQRRDKTYARNSG